MFKNLGSKYFDYKGNKTNFATEFRAGCTTYLTGCYILFLGPFIMSGNGKGVEGGFFDFGFAFTGLVVATVIANVIIGLYARSWPIMISQGLVINSIVAFTFVAGMGYTPAEALATVFLAGVAFFIASLTPLRSWILNSISMTLKKSIGAGIGLFLAFIALSIMDVIGPAEVTFVTLSDKITSPLTIMGLLTFVTICALHQKKVKGAIIIGLLFFAFLSWLPIWNWTGGSLENGALAQFNGIASMPPDMGYFFAAFEGFDSGKVFTTSGLIAVFVIWWLDIMDSMGTLTSVASVIPGRIDSKGRVKDIDKAFLSDASATVVGSLTGSSTQTSFIESGSGVAEKGKTGMVSLVVAALFLLSLFFAPLATSLSKNIDGAALLFVSVLFIQNIVDIDWKDITESAPGLLGAVSMPFLSSITSGICIMFITYAALKIFTGKASKTPSAIWVVAIISVLNFAV